MIVLKSTKRKKLLLEYKATKLHVFFFFLHNYKLVIITNLVYESNQSYTTHCSMIAKVDFVIVITEIHKNFNACDPSFVLVVWIIHTFEF